MKPELLMAPFALLMAAALPIDAAAAPAAQLRCNIGPAAALDIRGDRLFVGAAINGVQTEALLDSGAELTLVDQAFAAEIGLTAFGAETARGTGGEAPVQFAEIVSLNVAGVHLEGLTVAILDLSDIAARLIGGDLSLIAGREFFDAARIDIDFENGEICPIDRTSEPAGVRLPLEMHRGLATMPVTVEGSDPVQADFDLGNGNQVLIGAGFAHALGIDAPERVIASRKGGGIGGEILRDHVTLRNLVLAGVEFEDIEAVIDPTDNAADVNVGVRILRNFHLVVDFNEGAIWLAPY